MSSQLAKRARRAAGVAGRCSPSASSPTATPLIMLVTAAAVHTCRRYTCSVVEALESGMKNSFGLIHTYLHLERASKGHDELQNQTARGELSHHEAVAVLQTASLQRKATRGKAHAGCQPHRHTQRLPRCQQEPCEKFVLTYVNTNAFRSLQGQRQCNGSSHMPGLNQRGVGRREARRTRHTCPAAGGRQAEAGACLQPENICTGTR